MSCDAFAACANSQACRERILYGCGKQIVENWTQRAALFKAYALSDSSQSPKV